MGAHTAELEIAIQRKMDAHHITKKIAIRALRRRLEKAIVRYGDEIEEIVQCADGDRTEHEQSKVVTLESWISAERARIRDLDEIDAAT